jgi:cyclic beta-1,2-glucan synthetase
LDVSRSAEANLPLRGELLSVEGLEERAKSLATLFAPVPAVRASGRNVLPRLAENLVALAAAYRSLADDVHRGLAVPPAAEWLLDNFHLVESEALAVRHDLPERYYRKLLRVARVNLPARPASMRWRWS